MLIKHHTVYSDVQLLPMEELLYSSHLLWAFTKPMSRNWMLASQISNTQNPILPPLRPKWLLVFLENHISFSISRNIQSIYSSYIIAVKFPISFFSNMSASKFDSPNICLVANGCNFKSSHYNIIKKFLLLPSLFLFMSET